MVLCRYGCFAGFVLMLARSVVADPAIKASSIHDDRYQPHFAFDGDPATRWASVPQKGPAKPEWLQIDLGKVVPFEGLSIRWERACASHYAIEISDDAKTWRRIHEQKQGKGGTEVIKGLTGQGRYFRLHCLAPEAFGLYSVWEIEFTGAAAKALAEGRRALDEKRLAAEAENRRKNAASLKDLEVDEIVFAARASGVDGHWYANFGYYARGTERKLYGAPGGRLYRLNLKSGDLKVLLDDPQGHVRDPQMFYDGKKMVFSYRKGETENYNLYEINIDGTGLKQLTSGPWDDIEPCYLPDGGIMFVSSRCKRWVNCWLTQVAVLHRCDADGRNIRQISANVEHDNTPWVLPDGRILYQRWEYVDRSQVDYHHLWTTNPDGTGQMVYFGNMFPGILMIDAKPIPGTDQVLATFSPGHGRREHEGPFYVVDIKGGPDNNGGAAKAGGHTGRDPFPVGQKHILYAVGKTIRLGDYNGNFVELFKDPRFELHEPRPLMGRPREAVIAPRCDPAKETGKLMLADVHMGRNMEGVKPGEIKKLLVIESLPKPINYTGGMDPLSYGGSFTLERVVGTVPVEADGSAYLELPALRSFFFVAMDEKNLSVKRMQSFLTVQPGETTGCFGCHEQRTRTMSPNRDFIALRRPASKIEPIKDVPEIFDFPRDIQPILDKHCIACHDYDKKNPDYGPRESGVVLTGDRGPMFSHSYYTLTVRRQFADGRNEPKSNYAPRALGSGGSELMKKIDGSHYGAKPSPVEIDRIRYWIEAGATYPGTYAALGTGMIGGYDMNNLVETDLKWPQTIAAAQSMKTRCDSCHTKNLSLPHALADENGVSFWRPSWTDPRLHRARHMVFNLSRPEKSMILLAPLAKAAGGYGRCTDKEGHTASVFASTSDPDYQKLLAMVNAGKNRLEEITRFDMTTFKPEPAYLREMQRYGVLPATFDPAKDKVDIYDLDRRYWKSLWWQPQSAE